MIRGKTKTLTEFRPDYPQLTGAIRSDPEISTFLSPFRNAGFIRQGPVGQKLRKRRKQPREIRTYSNLREPTQTLEFICRRRVAPPPADRETVRLEERENHSHGLSRFRRTHRGCPRNEVFWLFGHHRSPSDTIGHQNVQLQRLESKGRKTTRRRRDAKPLFLAH